METLYSKLYDKYTRLKVKKETEIEKVSRDQEIKFVNYVSAADELVEYLKKEIEELHTQVDELRSEVASIRSSKDEQYADYQKLLFEENQKSKALTEEIERLQKSQPLETHNNTIKDIVTMEQPEIPRISLADSDTSNGLTMQRTRKRSRLDKAGGINSPSSVSAQEGFDHVKGKGNDLLNRTTPSQTALKMNLRPRKHSRLDKAGGVDYTSSASAQVKEKGCDLLNQTTPGQIALKMNLADCIRKRNGVSSGDCIFRNLAEYLAGMEFCTVDQTDGICISATHLSSGYSFSLTWVDENDEGKVELVYQLSSLGTLERIAPDWMREVIVFSTRMCPIFFERLYRVIKLR